MVNQSPREQSPAADERPDGAVARLLDAAAAPAEAGPQPGEQLALAAFRASHRTRRFSMFSHPTRAKAAVAATIGAGTFLFAGVGAAAAGVLPGSAQDAASSVLGTLGLDVPRADEHAGDDATDETTEVETEDTTEFETEETDQVDTQEADTEEAGDPADPDANDHGQAVSDVAKNTTEQGADKGAAVSGVASSKSQGKSQADEDHGKPEQPGAQAESHKTAAGDESTDDSADDEAEDSDTSDNDGPATADEKSGGRSSKTRP